RAINCDLTVQLATQAAAAGAKRFIFLSSIKVLGEGADKPYNKHSVPAPEGSYACSKWEAEQALLAFGQQSSMEIVILRPPLVYGPGVKGNLRQLMRAIDIGIPLPFGAVNNRRDLISIYNLCDAIVCSIERPVAGKTLLLSDGEPLSTKRLLTLMAKHQQRRCLLIPVPVSLMVLCAKLLGKSDVADRLLGDFEVDITHTKKVLNWQPLFSAERSFEKMFTGSVMK
ncbi:MAG: NAD-dependent epimerase/dehydratase family protein, partial [Pseudomonadales bacterium]|nr:NAD-dependent epimerase/dehydratase family protein [Pseudomonadales bacterium]